MRDHDMFKKPFAIDVTKTSAVPVPRPWKDKFGGAEVQVLPLIDGKRARGMAGWCVYEYNLKQCPEIEIICGGINDKMPAAASIFRQGNLLHFGFQQDPSEYNDVGRHLLLNSIAYIVRFKDDRPIASTPSIWLREKVMPERRRLTRYTHASLPKDPEARAAWLKKNRGVLVPNEQNRLVPDQDLLKLGVGSDDPKFFTTAIAALSGELEASARRVLGRYAPDGPGAKASAEEWRAYWKENGPFLFFNEASGYRWYLDPLAKKKGKPTAGLRGPARASKPEVAKRRGG